MRILDNQDQISSAALDNEQVPEHEDLPHDDSDILPPQSEAAKRIHLLGRLIIPPSTP